MIKKTIVLHALHFKFLREGGGGEEEEGDISLEIKKNWVYIMIVDFIILELLCH